MKAVLEVCDFWGTGIIPYVLHRYTTQRDGINNQRRFFRREHIQQPIRLLYWANTTIIASRKPYWMKGTTTNLTGGRIIRYAPKPEGWEVGAWHAIHCREPINTKPYSQYPHTRPTSWRPSGSHARRYAKRQMPNNIPSGDNNSS